MSTTKIEVYRDLFANVHNWLEGTMGDVTPEQAHWQPPGRVVPIAGHYIHHLTAEDAIINFGLRGVTPLLMGEWASRRGYPEPMPFSGPWDNWARSLTVDLDAARVYAQAVYANTDSYLAGLDDDQLAVVVDYTAIGFGEQPLSYILNQVLTDGAAHCGEISCIKGLQQQQGYPF